jgi:hypothetical protein
MQYSKIVVASVLASALGLLAAPDARAAFVATMVESGPNVVVTGSGTIDLAGFHNPYSMTGLLLSGIIPSGGDILIGPTGYVSTDNYTPYSGPSSFGSGGFTVASSGTGDRVGVYTGIGDIIVPSGYVSGSHLSSSATYDDATFASLGVTPGTYVWTWGAGNTLDSFTLDITAEAPVPTPEPPSLALFGAAIAALGWRRRRKAR